MRNFAAGLLILSLAACSPADQHKTEAQARAAASEVKGAVHEVTDDPQVKAAASSAKDSVKAAGTQLKDAALTTGDKIKDVSAEAKARHDAAETEQND